MQVGSTGIGLTCSGVKSIDVGAGQSDEDGGRDDAEAEADDDHVARSK